MFDRIEKILGTEEINKIKKTPILLIGLGGVGGSAFENLVRTGFQEITIIDEDCLEETNLNRQILATKSTITLAKVEAAQKIAQEINEQCKIKCIQKRITKEDVTFAFLKEYDYIIDACDTVSVKKELIYKCTTHHIKLISCMGTANRTHPEDLTITTLKKTKNDPLAKILRKSLKENEKCLKTKVICSEEIPKKQKELGTVAPVPMVAGAMLASYVINDLMKKEY